MAPRSASRDYETVIAQSPVRHAMFNKPFSNFRRRTENLLDTITGGTLSPDVEAEQRQERERTRALTCRHCQMVYANEDGLNKHYDLFPAHFTSERQPKNVQRDVTLSQQHQRSASQPLPAVPTPTHRSPVQSHVRQYPAAQVPSATPPPALQHRQSPVPVNPVQQLPNPPKRKPSVPYELHEQYASRSQSRQSNDGARISIDSRARSTPPHFKTSDEIPSSRPMPTVSYSSPSSSRVNFETLAPAFHAHVTVRPAEPAPVANAQATPIASAYAFDPHRFASDFYLPPKSGASGYDLAQDTSPSPYALTTAMTFAQNGFGQQYPPGAAPPRAAAMLPNFDFEANFTDITRDGVVQPPSARPVYAAIPQDTIYDRQGDINRRAGQRSVAHIAQADERRAEVRDGSIPVRGMSVPTLGNAVRAIVATGAAGPRGQPVMPMQSSSQTTALNNATSRGAQNAYMSLAGDEEHGQRARKESTSGRQWGTLLDALPGSPRDEREKLASSPKSVQPVKTGLTSFSDDAAPASPTSSTGNGSPTRSRRNTNPFLNREFMRNVPSTLKTPPLSPGSPWGTGSASPGNPFRQLSDDETDEASYFDALDAAPRTPADEVRVVPSSKTAQRMAMPGSLAAFAA